MIIMGFQHDLQLWIKLLDICNTLVLNDKSYRVLSFCSIIPEDELLLETNDTILEVLKIEVLFLRALLRNAKVSFTPKPWDDRFLLVAIDTLPVIDLASDKLIDANREKIFKFLLEDNGTKLFKKKETFNQLFDIAVSCQKGEITNVEDLNDQLKRVLKIYGGDIRYYTGLIILLLAILLKTCDIESFGPHGQIPQLPHIEAAKDFFNKCVKPENRGSKACPPRFQTS